MIKHLSLLAAAMVVSINLPAGTVPNVTVQSVYSEYTSGTADIRRATNVVNGAGLFGDVHTMTASGSMWLTLATTSGDFTNAYVTFDMGSVRPLDRMKVWNYNEAGVLTQRGIQRADILTAGEDLVFTTNFSNVFFDRAPGTFTNFGQVISLGGLQARYVRFNVKTNHYVSGTAENRVGLSEVQFFDTNIAPRVEFASRNYSSNKVTVLFSESVALSGATNIANYTIKTDGTNSASVSGASVELYNNRIVLNTTTLSNSNYTLQVSNVVSAVDGTVITNAEVTIEREVMLWLKADAGVTESGGFVSEWADQSGNGNTAFQADPLFQPTLVNNAINGQSVVYFSGATGFTNFMLVPHSPSLLVRAGDISIFAVMRFQTFNSFNTIVSKINTNTQPAPFDAYVRATGQVAFLRGNGWGNNTLNSSSNIVTAQPYVLSYVTKGTNGSEYLNGAFNGSVGTTAGFGDLAAPVAIGGRTPAVANFGTRLDGDIAELLIIRGGVSEDERIAIHDYLGTKYGVPIVNLVFNQHPTNQTKLEGQKATFSVSVTANSQNIAYQWQRAGTNIPNATNATYTTPYLTVAGDNNSTYRVLVSVPNSSQFSDTATLTVIPDQESPTIISAGRVIWDPSKIMVVFSERVDATTATAFSNYVLDNGAFITSASFGETTDKILLTTSGLTTNQIYTLSAQNIQDLYGNTIAIGQALVGIYPVAALWLSARSGVTVDGSGYIVQWDDLSGNGNHAAALAPAPFSAQLIAEGFNNQPIVRFDGSNSISLFAASSPSLAIVGDISIYSVGKLVDRTTHNAVVGKTTVNQPASFDFYMAQNSGLPTLYRGNGVNGTGKSVVGATPPTVGAPHIFSVVMSGTSVAHYLDGKTNGAGTLDTIMGDNGNSVGIGTREDGATKLKGDFAEFMIIGSALSDSDRANLDAYFGEAYGVLIGELPRLTVTTGAGSILLSWPDTAGFGLESSPTPSGGWTPITSGIVSENGTNSISITTTENQQFYQLRKQ